VEEAPEVELPADWADQDLIQLLYRTPSKKLLELKALAFGSAVIVHWCRGGDRVGEGRGDGVIKSVEIEAGEYVTDSSNAAAAFKRDKLAALVNKFAAGLDWEIAVRFSSASYSAVQL
jgi:hypothetical protein